MGATVKISRNFSELSFHLTEADMREAGELLVRRIRTRTEAGIDVNGAGFRAYSEGYAAQKRAALGHARVDLTVSGRMLNDMQVTGATANSAEITFISQGGGGGGGTFIQRSRALGAADKAAHNNPTREFFDVNESDKDAVVAGLEKLLEARFAE